MNIGSQRGMTLVEGVVGLAIMSSVLLMVAPTLGAFFPRVRFDEACRQIASDLSSQRLRAVERREVTTLTYSSSERTYVLGPYGFKRTLPDEIVSVTFPDVEFNSRGLVPSGSEITISLAGKNDRQLSIVLSPAGRIKLVKPSS